MESKLWHSPSLIHAAATQEPFQVLCVEVYDKDVCDGEMIRSHDLAMLGLDAGRVGSAREEDSDRIDMPPIDLERLGDGETLKDVTDKAVRAVERAAIAAALRRDRNPAAAAKRLGISRASIYTKMKTYGLTAEGEATETLP